MTVTVSPVRTRADRRAFLHLPWRIYRDDPYWVAPLLVDERRRFDRRRHPFFSHGDAEFFVARHGRTAVGRVAAIRNDLHLQTHRDAVGFFGFLECIDDLETARLLFDTAGDWLHRQGLATLRGPVGYSLNEDFGLHTAGFGSFPAVRCNHHRPYYAALMEALSFQPIKTISTFEARRDATAYPVRWKNAADHARQTLHITIRPFALHDHHRDAKRIGDIHQRAFAGQWGFVPLTDLELQFLARDIRRYGDPELIRLAEIDGEVIGCIVALPDWNQALRHLNGRLFPWGWLRLCRKTKHIDHIRVLMTGIDPRFRWQGVDALLYNDLYETAIAKGYRSVEASRVFQDNLPMRLTLQKTHSLVTRSYRLYERAL